jgi:hypothetical protein
MSLLLLLPSEWFALIAILLFCGHVLTGPCIRTDVRPVCPGGLHVEGVLVICSRGTRVLVSLGKGEALTYPLGRVPTEGGTPRKTCLTQRIDGGQTLEMGLECVTILV